MQATPFNPNALMPEIGADVHYVSYGTPGGEYTSQCRAATVTEIAPRDAERVGLCVINPTGLFFHPLSDGGCQQDESELRGGTWHWPDGALHAPENVER